MYLSQISPPVWFDLLVYFTIYHICTCNVWLGTNDIYSLIIVYILTFNDFVYDEKMYSNSICTLYMHTILILVPRGGRCKRVRGGLFYNLTYVCVCVRHHGKYLKCSNVQFHPVQILSFDSVIIVIVWLHLVWSRFLTGYESRTLIYLIVLVFLQLCTKVWYKLVN